MAGQHRIIFIFIPSCAKRGKENNWSNIFHDWSHKISAISDSLLLQILIGFVIFFCCCFSIVSLCPVILLISLVLKFVKDKLFHDCQWSGSTSTIKLINSFIFVNLLIKYIYPVTVNLISASYNAVMSLSSEIRNSFFITTICVILLLVPGSVEKNPSTIRPAL